MNVPLFCWPKAAAPGLLGIGLLLILLVEVPWWKVLYSSWDMAMYNLYSLCSFLPLFLSPAVSTSYSLSFMLSFSPFSLSCLSVSLLPGGVGAAKVAGSKITPELPESGQSESELSEVEGGAQATGNQLLLGAKARPGWSRDPMGQYWALAVRALLHKTLYMLAETAQLGGK